MIISFDPSIFKTDDPEVNEALSQIILQILKGTCKVDFQSMEETFLDEEGEYVYDQTQFAENYLSSHNRQQLKDMFVSLIRQGVYVTSMHQKYFSSFRIGTGNGNIDPRIAVRLLSERSLLVVENAANDWKMIRGLAQKYRKHRTRRSIYESICQAIEKRTFEPEQAGGKGQILARLNQLEAGRYNGILKHKVAALFDSDRQNDTYLNGDISAIIRSLKNREIQGAADAVHENADRIIWHMLVKCEMENYIPVSIVLRNIEGHPFCEELKKMPPEQVDYIKYELLVKNVPVKNDFPDYFLQEFTRELMEDRCGAYKVDIELPNGTKEQVSENESILLKIAKII